MRPHRALRLRGPSRSPACWRSGSSLRVAARRGSSALFRPHRPAFRADPVMSRLAMSDVPSAALVRWTWLFLARPRSGPAWWSRRDSSRACRRSWPRRSVLFVPLFRRHRRAPRETCWAARGRSMWAARVFRGDELGVRRSAVTSEPSISPISIAPRTPPAVGLGLLILVPVVSS